MSCMKIFKAYRYHILDDYKLLKRVVCFFSIYWLLRSMDLAKIFHCMLD